MPHPRFVVVRLCVVGLLVGGCAARASAQEHPMTPAGAGDGRKPLPLLPMMAEHQKQNMREHLEAVQAVVAGLSRGDMEAVEKAAARLGASETMARMCRHMGAAAPGFTAMALGFVEAAHGRRGHAVTVGGGGSPGGRR